MIDTGLPEKESVKGIDKTQKETLAIAVSAGFRRVNSPSVFLSRAVLLRKDWAGFFKNGKKAENRI